MDSTSLFGPIRFPGLRRSKYADEEDQLNSSDPTRGHTYYPLTDNECETIAWHFSDKALMTPARRLKPKYHWTGVVNMLRFENDPNKPLTKKQHGAYERLRDLGKLTAWKPDILAKIFLDIDELLFGAMLRDNIALRWCIEPENTAVAYTSPVGMSIQGFSSIARVAVVFNVPYVVGPYIDINEAITTAIHEFCHAILMVACKGVLSPGGDVATVDRRLPGQAAGHATAFEKVVETVQGRLGRTRFIHITKFVGQEGGTVSFGSYLHDYWVGEGRFRIGSSAKDRRYLDLISERAKRQEESMWNQDGTPREARRGRTQRDPRLPQPGARQRSPITDIRQPSHSDDEGPFITVVLNGRPYRIRLGGAGPRADRSSSGGRPPRVRSASIPASSGGQYASVDEDPIVIRAGETIDKRSPGARPGRLVTVVHRGENGRPLYELRQFDENGEFTIAWPGRFSR